MLCVDRIAWHPEKENFLLSLHHGQSLGQLVLWNTKDSALVWSLAISDFAAGASLSFSPFEPTVVAFSSSIGAVSFIRDFSLTRQPGMMETKYRIGGPANAQQQQQQQRKLSQLTATSNFRQFAFSPHLWNVVYFLLARELIVFDMTLDRAIGSTALDRNCEPFQSLLLCQDNPSLLFCLHEDGSLSSWKRLPERFEFELNGLTIVSQIQRKGQKKKNTPASLTMCPVDQTKLVTISLEGTFWVWEYSDQKGPESETSESSRLPSKR